MIQILYFASVRETLDCAEEQFNLDDDIKTIAELKTCLSKRGDAWNDVFENTNQLLSSVNQTIVKDNQTINDGDEVAFFPQVTGG